MKFPDKEALVPVPLVGFKSLQSRIKRQEHQGKIYQGRLDEIANDIAESQKVFFYKILQK